MADTSADLASLAYWRNHIKDGYKGTANGDPAKRMAEAIFDVGMRMLQGQGVKYTDVPIVPPIIRPRTCRCGCRRAGTRTLEDRRGAGGSWASDSYLNKFFTTRPTRWSTRSGS